MKIQEQQYWGLGGLVLVLAGMCLPWIIRPSVEHPTQHPVALILGFVISTAAMPLVGLGWILGDLAKGQQRPKLYAIAGGLILLSGLVIWIIQVRRLSDSPFDLLGASFASLTLVGGTTLLLIARVEQHLLAAKGGRASASDSVSAK